MLNPEKNPMRPKYMLLILLYCGLIFWLSSKTEFDDPTLDFPGKDKVAHMVLFGGLGLVTAWGRFRSAPGAGWVSLHLAPLIFVGLYGLSDEIHQLFVPNRTFDLLDLAADVAGGLAAQVLLYLVVIRRTLQAGRKETVCEIRG